MDVPRTSMIPTSVPSLSIFSPTSPNHIGPSLMTFSSNSPLISSQDASSRDEDIHIAKRIKIESPSAAQDSNLDPFVPFEDDISNLGSFEIDYSKLYGPAGQARLLMQSTPRLGSGFYTEPCPATACSAAATLTEELLDDSAFEHAFSDDEDMVDSTIMDEPLAESDRLPFAKGGIYSTPSTWDKPHLDPRPATRGGLPAEVTHKLTDGHAWDVIRQSGNFLLTPEERRQLIEIAMGPPRHFYAYASPNNFGSGVGFPNPMQPNPISQQFGIGNDAAALRLCAERSRHIPFVGTGACGALPLPRADRNPEMDLTAVSEQTPTTLKRPLAEAGAKARSADRLAHNDVERKYRTNLKDKITELRNAVPALQQAYSTESSTAPSAKVSKGTVLTKATEYIHQLEQRNQEIMTEHQYLVRRLQAFETLLNSSMCSSDMMPSHSMTLFDPRGFC